MRRRKPKFKPDIVIHSEYMHFLGNNYLKLHGMPMRRHKHVERERAKQWERFIDKWNALGHPGPILTAEEIRRLLNEKIN